MIVNEKNLSSILEEEYNDHKVMCLNLMNINELQFNNLIFEKVEILCLAFNDIYEVNFIQYFPNLYCFDLRGNNLINLNFLNEKKTFGYLAMSVQKYNQAKILDVYDLNIGIMILENIENQNYLEKFKENNPNILRFNNHITLLSQSVYFTSPKKNKKNKSVASSIITNEENINNVKTKPFALNFIAISDENEEITSKDNINSKSKIKIEDEYFNNDKENLNIHNENRINNDINNNSKIENSSFIHNADMDIIKEEQRNRQKNIDHSENKTNFKNEDLNNLKEIKEIKGSLDLKSKGKTNTEGEILNLDNGIQNFSNYLSIDNSPIKIRNNKKRSGQESVEIFPSYDHQMNSLKFELDRTNNNLIKDLLNFFILLRSSKSKTSDNSNFNLSRMQLIKIFEIDMRISDLFKEEKSVVPKSAFHKIQASNNSINVIDKKILRFFINTKQFYQGSFNDKHEYKNEHKTRTVNFKNMVNKDNTKLDNKKLQDNHRVKKIDNSEKSIFKTNLLMDHSHSLNKVKNKVRLDTKETMFKSFDYNEYLYEKTSLQLLFNNTLLLYILGVVSKEMFLYIISIISKLELEKKYNLKNLNTLFTLDFDYLIGFHYFLYEKLVNMHILSNQVNNVSILKFENLYSHIDFLKRNLENNKLLIFSCNELIDNSKIKAETINKMIREYAKFDNIKDILYLIQTLNDTIIINKYDKFILENHPFIYYTFLQIKDAFFKELSKTQQIYSSYSEKILYDYIEYNQRNKVLLQNVSKDPIDKTEEKNRTKSINFNDYCINTFQNHLPTLQSLEDNDEAVKCYINKVNSKSKTKYKVNDKDNKTKSKYAELKGHVKNINNRDIELNVKNKKNLVILNNKSLNNGEGESIKDYFLNYLNENDFKKDRKNKSNSLNFNPLYSLQPKKDVDKLNMNLINKKNLSLKKIEKDIKIREKIKIELGENIIQNRVFKNLKDEVSSFEKYGMNSTNSINNSFYMSKKSHNFPNESKVDFFTKLSELKNNLEEKEKFSSEVAQNNNVYKVPKLGILKEIKDNKLKLSNGLTHSNIMANNKNFLSKNSTFNKSKFISQGTQGYSNISRMAETNNLVENTSFENKERKLSEASSNSSNYYVFDCNDMIPDVLKKKKNKTSYVDRLYEKEKSKNSFIPFSQLKAKNQTNSLRKIDKNAEYRQELIVKNRNSEFSKLLCPNLLELKKNAFI